MNYIKLKYMVNIYSDISNLHTTCSRLYGVYVQMTIVTVLYSFTKHKCLVLLISALVVLSLSWVATVINR